MARKKTTETKKPVESYEHLGKHRGNNPPVGLVTPDTNPVAPVQFSLFAARVEEHLKKMGFQR